MSSYLSIRFNSKYSSLAHLCLLTDEYSTRWINCILEKLHNNKVWRGLNDVVYIYNLNSSVLGIYLFLMISPFLLMWHMLKMNSSDSQFVVNSLLKIDFFQHHLSSTFLIFLLIQMIYWIYNVSYWHEILLLICNLIYNTLYWTNTPVFGRVFCGTFFKALGWPRKKTTNTARRRRTLFGMSYHFRWINRQKAIYFKNFPHWTIDISESLLLRHASVEKHTRKNTNNVTHVVQLFSLEISRKIRKMFL